MTAPPGALLLIAFGAGLATGLARFPDPRLVFLAALCVAAGLRHHTSRVHLVALAVGVILGAIAARPDPRDCRRVLGPGEHSVAGVLAEPGATGIVRVDVHSALCHGSVRVLWPRDASMQSGTPVEVRGRWVPRLGMFGEPEGLLVARTAVATGRAAGRVSDRLHDAVATRSQLLFGRRAPLVDALVTGRRGEMPQELKDAFTASGLVHLLSISGFHIGLIAGWILLVLRLAQVHRHVAEGAAALAALAYVAFLGWPAPAARAGWFLVLVAWSRWRQRSVHPIALLATSCLVVVTLDPRSVGALGGWLSAGALGGAIAASRWSDRMLGRGWGWRTLAGSIGATLGTAPITALAFGQVALVGIVLNFIAIPLAAAAVPAVLAALLLHPVLPATAAAFAAAGGALLDAVERVAAVGAAVPFGQWHGEPGASAMLPWLLGIAIATALVHGRATAGEASRRLAWAGVAGCWVVLALSVPRAGAAGRLTLHFLDVGQGDATLIRTPHGRWVAVDAGPSGDAGDAGRRVVAPFLKRHGARRLDLFVLSHAHRDHVGGALSTLGRVPVGMVLDPGQPFTDDVYLGLLAQLAERGTRWRVASAGDAWTLDGVSFRVVHPAVRWKGGGLDLNEDSIVLEVRYGSFTAVLAGDSGFPAEREFAARVGDADVLKVGHHGSRGSTGDTLLAALDPVVAIVSLGRNRYGHPAPETMQRLAAAGVRSWRTDREGTTTITTDGSSFAVRGERTSATFNAARATRPRR